MNTDKIYAESIVNQYSPKETSKVVALKKLDKKAKKRSNVVSITVGCVSTLMLGIGMCLTMNQIGNGSVAHFVLGIVVGVLGIAGIAAAPVLHKKIFEKDKQRYAGDIVALATKITEADDN